MDQDTFLTISAREKNAAVERYGYVEQAIARYAYFVQVAGSVPLFRLRNAASGLHRYTTSASERESLTAQSGYQDEGVACFVPTTSGTGAVEEGAFAVYDTSQPNTVQLFRLISQPDSMPIPRKIRGFADLHNHQFANLGFGGLAFAGLPYGPMEKALAHCDRLDVHGPGGTLDVLGNLRNLIDGVTAGIGHRVAGYPEFDGWPRWNNLTHQAVYQDWLKRALDGGLKLLVMLAVNNELVAEAANRAPGRSSDDMEAVDLQLQFAHKMETYIDAQCGGPGKGWYRIVRSPQEARDAIEAGQLAVVLGIEVDNIFGGKTETPPSILQILNVLDKYYEMGVRHVFPVHFDDNAFGATGFQNILVGDPAVFEAFNPYDPSSAFTEILGITGWPSEITTRPASSEGYAYRGGRVNAFGLTELGRFFIQALMNKGMLVDTDHMSAASFHDTLAIAQESGYPTVSSHTGFIEIGVKDRLHEGNMKAEQAEMIQANGGVIACILTQGSLEETKTWRGIRQTVVEHTCGDSSETWAQAYLYVTEKTSGMPIALGTDFNGMIHPTGPRFGPDGCHAGKSPDHAAHPRPPVGYPFTALATGARLEHSAAGHKTFDINTDGLAHIGLLPDFIADLQQIGLSEADLDPLLSSAEGYIQMWELAERRKPELQVPPLSAGPWWVQVGGGFFKSEDKDLIHFKIEPGAVEAEAVEFALELYGSITWPKEVQIETDHGTITLAAQNERRADRWKLFSSQLTGARLRFKKDKLPGELLNLMIPVLEMEGPEFVPGGSRVTIQWIRDKG